MKHHPVETVGKTQILTEQDMKIRTLYREFENIKHKIQVCEKKRKEEQSYEVTAHHYHHKQPHSLYNKKPLKKSSQNKVSQSPYPYLPEIDHEKDVLKGKLEKYEKLVKEQTEVFMEKEAYFKKLLKQQKINFQIMKESYQTKLNSASKHPKLQLPNIQDLLSRVSFSHSHLEEKLNFFSKRMQYLNQLLIEIKKATSIRITKLKQEMQEIIKEKINLEIDILEKDQKIKFLQEQQLLKREQEQSLDRVYDDSYTNDLLQKLEDLQKEQQKEKENYEYQINQIKNQLVLQQEHTQELDNQLKKTSKQNERLKADLNKAQANYVQQIQLLKSSHNEQYKKLKQAKAEQEIHLNQQFQQQFSQLSQKNQEIKDCLKKIEELEEENIDLLAQIKKSTTNNSSLKTQIQKLEQELKQLPSLHQKETLQNQKQLQEFQKNHMKLLTQKDKIITSLNQEIISLNKKIEIMTSALKLSEANNSKTFQNISVLNSKIQSQDQSIIKLNNELKTLNETIIVYDREIKIKSKECQQLLLDSQVKEQKITKLQQELKKGKNNNNNNNDMLNKALSASKKENDKYQKQIEELKRTLEITLAQLQEERNKVTQKSYSLNNNQDKSLSNDSSDFREKAKVENQRLQNCIRTLEIQNQDLKNRLILLQNQCNTLNTTNTKLEKEYKELKLSIEEKSQQSRIDSKRSSLQAKAFESKFKEFEEVIQKLTRELEQKQVMINVLKQRKTGFQNLFIQLKNIDKKEDEQFQQIHTPLFSTLNIKDKEIQNIKSDPEDMSSNESPEQQQDQQQHNMPQDQEMQEQFPSQLSQNSDRKRKNKSHKKMMYSYHPGNQKRAMEDKYKQLEHQLNLVIQQNNFLKSKKQRLEEEIKEFEEDQQRIVKQKDVLKNEFNTTFTQFSSLKDLLKKLFVLLFSEKKQIKTHLNLVRDYFNLIFKMVLEDKQGELSHQFTQAFQSKKGIFSIL